MKKLSLAIMGIVFAFGLSSQAYVLNCTLDPAVTQPIGAERCQRFTHQNGYNDEVQLRLDFGKQKFSLNYYRGMCHGWPVESQALGELIGPESSGNNIVYNLKGKRGYFHNEPVEDFEARIQADISQPNKFEIELFHDRYALICTQETAN